VKKVLALASMVVVAASLGVVLTPRSSEGAGAVQLPGTWRRLPASPVVPDFDTARAVWTGTQVIAFGRDTLTARDAHGNPYAKETVNVAAAYRPAGNRWRALAPPPAGDVMGAGTAVWTGTRLVVMSPFTTLVYDPSTDHWRRIGRGHGGLVAWTGRELLAWGGGCCGDAASDGVAYSPTTNAWRRLPRSPLAGSQQPVGAWTGRELVVVVGKLDPDGKPWPAGLARAAAYNPATNTWRRIAPLPASRDGASAVWDGHELLVVGGATGKLTPGAGFAYDPASNRWRPLASMGSGRTGALAVWTGDRLLLWGGKNGAGKPLATGLAYDRGANRWSPLPHAPLSSRIEAAAVWTGRSLVLWGGVPTKTWGKFAAGGAVFTPATP
jgi:hypothetical protein